MVQRFLKANGNAGCMQRGGAFTVFAAKGWMGGFQ